MKVAIVTGGSGGIGRCTAHSLAEAGCRVFELSRHGESDAAVEHVTCDVTDEGAVRAAVAEVTERAGRVDILVCNAGFGISGAAELTSSADAHAQLELNLFGMDNAVRAVLPQMRAQRGGRIVCMSSIAGILPILRRAARGHTLRLHERAPQDAGGRSLRRARGQERGQDGARRGDGHEPRVRRSLCGQGRADAPLRAHEGARRTVQGRRHGRKAAAQARLKLHSGTNVRQVRPHFRRPTENFPPGGIFCVETCCTSAPLCVFK